MSARRRTRRRRRADERGIALILVLGSITLLTVFLTQLQEETSSELAAALSERDALKAEYYARSGINLTRMLIATEPTIAANVGPILMILNQGAKGGLPQIPVWEFTDMVLGPFNDAAGTQSFLATIGADATSATNLGIQGGGRFELTVVDEDSKINLNLAARNTFQDSMSLAMQLLGLMAPPSNDPLFQGQDADGQFSDRQTICSALIDWVDSDPSGNEQQDPCQPQGDSYVAKGPEDNFYQTIGLPYVRKNAAFDSLDEARLVRGMSDDFWATFVDPEPQNPKKRNFSVWGQGEININAANPQTMLAIVCGAARPETQLCNDPLQMAAFIQLVTLGKGMTMGMPLFGSGKDFVNQMKGQGMIGSLLTMPPFGIQPVIFKDEKGLAKSLRTKSKRFSIYADGVVPGYKRVTKVRIHAVVDYRDAGQLGPMGSVVIGGGMAAAAAAMGGTPGPSTGPSTGTSGAQALTPDDILTRMNSNPAGTIIYWRVE